MMLLLGQLRLRYKGHGVDDHVLFSFTTASLALEYRSRYRAAYCLLQCLLFTAVR